MEEDEEQTMTENKPEDFEPIPHNHHECERVIINISGEKYETQVRTLSQFPNTLLGNPRRMLRYFDPIRNEYFLDRNRPAFDAILYFYQSGGTLLRPSDVPLDIFCEEIQFYELGDEVIEAFKIEEGYMVEEEELLPTNKLQRDLWLLLEHPETSVKAQVFAVFSVFVICFSIFLFCLETVLSHNRYTLFQITGNKTSVEEDEIPDFGNPFFVIESMCIAWFCMELILRLIGCPDKIAFLTDIMNAVDVIAILPYFLTLATVLTEDENAILISKLEQTEDEGFSLANLKVTRVARVFRIFKLSRHSKGLRIILMTFKASINEIGLLVFLLSIMTVLYASFVYFAEANSEDSYFKSIPEAFWWAIVTMTTVGYGDVTPMQFWGKVVGAICVFSGLLTLALPSPFIETNFMHYYTREQRQWQFMTEPPDHVECCPFLPGHCKLKDENTEASILSDSQLSLDQLINKRKENEQLTSEDYHRLENIVEEEADTGNEDSPNSNVANCDTKSTKLDQEMLKTTVDDSSEEKKLLTPTHENKEEIHDTDKVDRERNTSESEYKED